jgi:hypothetical protein
VRLTCLHGFFIVKEDAVGEIAKFNSIYSQDLTARHDYYTFALLAESPIYSISPSAWLGAVTSKTFCGEPWEIMRENGLVYNISAREVQQIASITTQAQLNRLRTCWSSRGLVQPGSLTTEWEKITGYQCAFDFSNLNFYYTEFFYD